MQSPSCPRILFQLAVVAWLGLLLAAGARPMEMGLGQGLLVERAKTVVVAANAPGKTWAQRYRGYSTEEDDWKTVCVGTSAPDLLCQRSDIAVAYEERALTWPPTPRVRLSHFRTHNPRDPPVAVI